jgi:hypothetical protein
MSREKFDASEGVAVIVGYDKSFKTFWAQLWDRDHDPDFDMGSPKAVVGYHDAEKVPPLAGEYGPYPVPTVEALDTYLRQAWNVEMPDDTYTMLSGAET